jgi:hypothetical protein
MKKQGYLARLAESVGERNRGPHKQSPIDRARESRGMEKAEGKRPYSADKGMDMKGHIKSAMHHLRKAHKCK